MFKIQNVRGKVRNLVAAAGTIALTGLAMAQTADPFDAAQADGLAKVAKYGASLVTLAAVGVGFMIAIKYVKKIARAA